MALIKKNRPLTLRSKENKFAWSEGNILETYKRIQH